MSSRRSNGSSPNSTVSTDDQLNFLMLKLQALVPQINNQTQNGKVSASKVLKETCDYIRRLHREVDDLSDRLSQLLDSSEDIINGVDGLEIRNLLQQL